MADSSSFNVKVLTPEGEVFGNHALVLVGEAIEPGDLDPSDLKERISNAEKRLSEAEQDSAAAKQAELEKERYEAFLSVAESN